MSLIKNIQKLFIYDILNNFFQKSMSNQFSSFTRKNLFLKTQFLHRDILYLLRQYILTRGLNARRGRKREGCGVRGDEPWMRFVSALHRNELSSWSGLSQCTWCTSRLDLDAAPGWSSLGSFSSSLFLRRLASRPFVGWDELKRPENPLWIVWNRSETRDPDSDVYGVCQNHQIPSFEDLRLVCLSPLQWYLVKRMKNLYNFLSYK